MSIREWALQAPILFRIDAMQKITLVLFLMGSSLSMADSPNFSAKIDTMIENDVLVVVPHIEADTSATLRYELLARKEGKSGISNSTQGGMVAVSQGKPQFFSRLELGLAPADRYAITLSIYDGKKLVARDAVSYPK